MRDALRSIGVALFASGAMVAAASGQNTAPRHARGLVVADPDAYSKLPSVDRHRAWLSPAVDLTAHFPPVGNQGPQGACTAWATGYASRSFILGEEVGHAPRKIGELVSPAYIYNRLRKDKRDCKTQGVSFADALNLLTNEGVVTLADLPYGDATCTQVPSDSQVAKAGKLRIGGFRAIQREIPDDWRTPVILDDIKGQLQAGLPVVFSLHLPDNFDVWHGSGVYDTDEVGTSWHAMVLAGYDESKQAFRLMNSWGEEWGDKGFAWISYRTFARLAGEAYVLKPLTAEHLEAGALGPAMSVDQQLTNLAYGLDCGNVAVKGSAGKRVATGFTGARDGYASAKTKALALDPMLKWNVAYRPWPQCEAELTLSEPLMNSVAKISVRGSNGQALIDEDAVMKENDLFSIEVATTKAAPYLDVIYLQADGSAVELYHGEAKPDTGYKVVLGAAGKREARFQVAPPLGDEVLIAVASNKPVFGESLGKYRTERQFLTVLRTRLAETSRQGQLVYAAIQRMKTTR
jgi:hypothetical protein